MTTQVIFFQGGGSEEDYKADSKLVDSLKKNLGSNYSIHYPRLTDDGTPDLGRRKEISKEISNADDNCILVAHSFGASMLLATLSEMKISKKIKGIFLLATPFWSGDEDWVQPYKLKTDFAKHLDKKIPMFFYHCSDDEEVPFEQFNEYKRQVSWATFREIPKGGHQFNNDLKVVAGDIESL